MNIKRLSLYAVKFKKDQKDHQQKKFAWSMERVT